MLISSLFFYLLLYILGVAAMIACALMRYESNYWDLPILAWPYVFLSWLGIAIFLFLGFFKSK